MNKISICTVCMNRTSYLRQTLPVNIKENSHYPGIEFVLLDYNSRDGMEDWAKTSLREYIDAGLLKYYKTIEPEFFRVSHSRNMAAKLATGDILCLIDADNFAGVDYAGYVNSVFEEQDSRPIITTLRKDGVPYRDQGGKICVRKEHFQEANGFDEDMVFYGVEDVDLVSRLERLGGTRHFINDDKYLRYIGHSDMERVINHSLINKIDSLYVLQSAKMQTENSVLYLFTDNSFVQVKYVYEMQAQKRGTISSFGGWMIAGSGPGKGTYTRVKNDLVLTFNNGTKMAYQEGAALTSKQPGSERQTWKRLNENDEWFIKLLMAYGECINRMKNVKNEAVKETVNAGGWGKGVVYSNFDVSRTIAVS